MGIFSKLFGQESEPQKPAVAQPATPCPRELKIVKLAINLLHSKDGVPTTELFAIDPQSPPMTRLC